MKKINYVLIGISILFVIVTSAGCIGENEVDTNDILGNWEMDKTYDNEYVLNYLFEDDNNGKVILCDNYGNYVDSYNMIWSCDTLGKYNAIILRYSEDFSKFKLSDGKLTDLTIYSWTTYAKTSGDPNTIVGTWISETSVAALIGNEDDLFNVKYIFNSDGTGEYQWYYATSDELRLSNEFIWTDEGSGNYKIMDIIYETTFNYNNDKLKDNEGNTYSKQNAAPVITEPTVTPTISENDEFEIGGTWISEDKTIVYNFGSLFDYYKGTGKEIYLELKEDGSYKTKTNIIWYEDYENVYKIHYENNKTKTILLYIDGDKLIRGDGIEFTRYK